MAGSWIARQRHNHCHCASRRPPLDGMARRRQPRRRSKYTKGDILNEMEVIERVEALPDQFAGRVPEDTLDGLRLMDRGGEYGELTIELAATLAKTGAPVSREERDELHELLTAMDMPTDPIRELNVTNRRI